MDRRTFFGWLGKGAAVAGAAVVLDLGAPAVATSEVNRLVARSLEPAVGTFITFFDARGELVYEMYKPDGKDYDLAPLEVVLTNSLHAKHLRYVAIGHNEQSVGKLGEGMNGGTRFRRSSYAANRHDIHEIRYTWVGGPDLPTIPNRQRGPLPWSERGN